MSSIRLQKVADLIRDELSALLGRDVDETRAALEYGKKLAAVMPKDVYAWDDAGNNRWLISGKGAQRPPLQFRVRPFGIRHWLIRT
jgi:hypothetical protein